MATVHTFNSNPHDLREIHRSFRAIRVQLPQASFDQADAPDEFDDITKGWKIGSKWIDKVSVPPEIYECAINDENGAIWKRMVALDASPTGGVGGVGSTNKLLVISSGLTKTLDVTGSDGDVLTLADAETLDTKWKTPPANALLNGSTVETFATTIAEAGGVITLSLAKVGGGDLTLNFNGAQTTFDVSEDGDINLTVGASDSNPTENFIYILASDPTSLVKDATDWPDAQHIKISYCLVQTAATFASQGILYSHQDINNHQAGTDGQGHLEHIASHVRHDEAKWISGCAATATQDGDGNRLWISVATGAVRQLHPQVFPALDSEAPSSDPITVFNDPDAAYTARTDLNTITKYSGSGTIPNNRWVIFTLWCCVHSDGTGRMYLNLPAGGYVTEDQAIADVENHIDTTLPPEFNLRSTTGFLNTLIVCRHTSTGMIFSQLRDLRGRGPNTSGTGPGGGDVSAPAAFGTDNAIIVADGVDKDVQASTATIADTGVMSVPGIGSGAVTAYDLKVGNVTTPSYGMMRIGDCRIGRTSHNAGNINLDGTLLISNMGGPVSGDIEVILTESASDTCRFAWPKSGAGLATYNPRSMLMAGPAPADTDFVKVSYWQAQGIFHNLVCDVDGGDGADLGVQNDLEVEGDIFTDNILESTAETGVTIEGVLLKDSSIRNASIGPTNTLNGPTVSGALWSGGTSGTSIFAFSEGATANPANFPVWINADAGSPPIIAVGNIGGDANVDLEIRPKGTGVVRVYNEVSGDQAMQAAGLDANVSLLLDGKGTGTVQTLTDFRIGAGTATDKLLLGGSSTTEFIHQSAAGDLHLEADDKVNINVANPVEGLTVEMGGSEVARFHPAEGALCVGITAPETDALLHLAAEGSNHLAVIQVANTSQATPILQFMRSRGTLASPTAVSSGDNVFFIRGNQYNGTAWVTRVRWFSQATGSNAAKLVMQTGNAGLSTAFEILENNNLLMRAGNALQLRDSSTGFFSPSSGRLRYESTTDHQWQVGGANEMTLSANTLTLETGGTSPTLSWAGAAGNFDINSNGNRMMSFESSFVGVHKPLIINDSLKFMQEAADPAEPGSGQSVMWASDGTGFGAAGDIIMASNVGGTTKKRIVFVYVGATAW